MDYLEDYYSNYWAQLLAAQTGQNTQTTTSANSDSTGLSFSDLLYSLSGVSGEDSASQMQNHLLSGVADGSIPLTDSHTFVPLC